MEKTASLFKGSDWGTENVNGFIRFWAVPGRPWGGIVPSSPVLAPAMVLLSRVSAWPYTPPRCLQCTSEHSHCGICSFLVLVRRLALVNLAWTEQEFRSDFEQEVGATEGDLGIPGASVAWTLAARHAT